MIIHRKSNTLGNPISEKINSHRTFSFPPYYDPKYMKFGNLKTINDDTVLPGFNVPEHSHKNMEIFGYVVKGFCRHTDTIGNIIDIPAGSVQRMSCGSGIRHTEGNSSNEENRYLQLWIEPNILNTEPLYEWCKFTREDKLNKFVDITKKLPIKQDAKLLAGIFTENFNLKIDSNRKYYLYIISGNPIINDISLIEKDSLSFMEEENINIFIKNNESEIILFDLK